MLDLRAIAPRIFLPAVIFLLAGLLITRTGRSQEEKKEKGTRQSIEQMEATPFAEKNQRQAMEASRMPEVEMAGRHQATLPDQVRRTGKDAGVYSYPMPAEVPGHPSDPPGSLITQESDIVIVGTVTGKQSFLTEHQTDVFTEYSVTVSEVLKNDAENSAQPMSTLYFARAGGSISFEGHLIYHTFGGGVRPLQIGATCLLFLKHLPDMSDAYRGRAFLIENGALKACDGLKEFDEGFPLSEARKNIVAAAKPGGAR